MFTYVHTQMENQVIVSDYSQMDRILREERQYILNICKKIKKAGCNVLLIQKSILRWVWKLLVTPSYPCLHISPSMLLLD